MGTCTTRSHLTDLGWAASASFEAYRIDKQALHFLKPMGLAADRNLLGFLGAMQRVEDFVWADPPHQAAFPVAREGYPLIGAAAFATLILAMLGLTVPSLLGLTATLCIAGFFRDPDRIIPNQAGQVVSPADGRVIVAEIVSGSPFFDEPVRKISIFMSIFNVHVNRVPVEGRICRINYRPGQFVAADRRDAPMRNEHNAVFVETPNGAKICFVQVAGLIARRIICSVQPDETVRRGQRFGMICFGSRLDLYLPQSMSLAVSVGDKVMAGSTVLGSLPVDAGVSH